MNLGPAELIIVLLPMLGVLLVVVLAWSGGPSRDAYMRDVADAQALADMLWTLYACPVPVVGRVHGDCYAGGVGLAAVCDVLVAAEGVNFCLSEAKLGLLPATIGPYVVKAMGEQAARRWFLTAERFSAAQAQAMGFVHECVAPPVKRTWAVVVDSS